MAKSVFDLLWPALVLCGSEAFTCCHASTKMNMRQNSLR